MGEPEGLMVIVNVKTGYRMVVCEDCRPKFPNSKYYVETRLDVSIDRKCEYCEKRNGKR